MMQYRSRDKTLLETGWEWAGLWVSFWYSLCMNVICVPLFFWFNVFKLAREIFYQVREVLGDLCGWAMEKVSLRKRVRSVALCVRERLTPLCQETEDFPRSQLLRQSRSQQQILTTFQKAEANPNEITQNEKVVLMMQKMKRIEDTLFQQSRDRQKIESELIEARNELKQKNVALIKERSECIENMNKINLLNLHLTEKSQLLEKSTKHVVELEAEVKVMKEKLEQVMTAKKEESETINSQLNSREEDLAEPEEEPHETQQKGEHQIEQEEKGTGIQSQGSGQVQPKPKNKKKKKTPHN